MAASQPPKHTLTLSPNQHSSPLRTQTTTPSYLPAAKQTHSHPRGTTTSKDEDAHLRFIGTATTILEWRGIRILTDPNFLHAGDHVHLGPGVTGTRLTNPAIDLEDLPNIDVVLLSHYHADHFDQKVEDELRRDLPIITTPHAKENLVDKKDGEERFTAVKDLDFWEAATLNITPSSSSADANATEPVPVIKVTGMPGKHIPPGPLSVANDLLAAVPPTNGWMVELGYSSPGGLVGGSLEEFSCGYRIYISGDTLFVPELNDIATKYTHAGKEIDLMLIHLGGTTIPSPKVPLLMVTMDAQQGVKLMQLVKPDVTVPVHFDDYDVFVDPLENFKKAVEEAGLSGGVVYLDRGEGYGFGVRRG